MKRDKDLIRALLIKLEDLNVPPLGLVSFPYGDEELAVEGYTVEQVLYHLELIAEAGLVEVQGSGFGADGTFLFRRLTWNGHEFLDAVRDPEIWRETKGRLSKVGAWSLDVVVGVAKALAKQKAKELLGLEL
ncbi:DUF2513 domain-containing protein [Salinarimonas soli]|uniref:DUF2513 domain-containing protein n=1 Tax=Salinarimonas soli TaxID=1638099 RepID=A0A5B2VSQ5_9HYPH|nr:DUF2513 domain-containing protein [Salinarimonas soli]KAA2241129.1 DUF2513 domain-containing protein [Salinarimonas soli]